MLKIILSVVAEWGWTQWMFLHLLVAGTCSLVTVHQPPVLTTALGHDVVMPCQLNLSHDDKMVTPPVLYWVYLSEDTENARVWTPSEKYKERVHLLDNDLYSSNKSISLKNVQWADSGKYLCKVSVATKRDERFRRKGNETLLMVYDTMMFNLIGHNASLLSCEVNVTRDPGFVLSLLHDGHKPQSVDSAAGDYVTALPYVTLTQNISVWGEGKYECQLHLNEDLITKSTFHYRPPVAGEPRDAEKNASSVSEPGAVVFPEPWLLYVALLLVPSTVLLGLVTALLMRRS
ncbi:uncharacterized protein LOC121610688 [Chelmon rostratus]|uniref:uncharacterized protein LOC121610688 n=1 Tax=Chelmon rostratus TaxID=109905 RepID=UPI001BE70353|nr:uncharacterized protein LOC121610688 [Chelmon rostratus]